MSLINKQADFLKDMAKLINYAFEQGYLITGGELFRPYDMQLLYFYGKNVKENNGSLEIVEGKKRSWTMSSKHLQRLAIDLNVFIKKGNNWHLTYKVKDIQKLGDFWESLNTKNKWGGNWKTPDTPHFQRNIN